MHDQNDDDQILSPFPNCTDWEWADAEQTVIKSESSDGTIIFVSADDTPGSGYLMLLKSGVIVEDYVEPPSPPEPTAEEKLARSGLTVDELKDLLGL